MNAQRGRRRSNRGEDIGAAAAQGFRVGKEQFAEVQRRGGTLDQQGRAALARDGGEAFDDIRSSGEDQGLDAGADRGLRRAGIIAAIQYGSESGVRYGGPACVDEGAPPSRADRQPGFGRAEQGNRKAGLGSRP